MSALRRSQKVDMLPGGLSRVMLQVNNIFMKISTLIRFQMGARMIRALQLEARDGVLASAKKVFRGNICSTVSYLRAKGTLPRWEGGADIVLR